MDLAGTRMNVVEMEVGGGWEEVEEVRNGMLIWNWRGFVIRQAKLKGKDIETKRSKPAANLETFALFSCKHKAGYRHPSVIQANCVANLLPGEIKVRSCLISAISQGGDEGRDMIAGLRSFWQVGHCYALRKVSLIQQF